MPIFNANLSMMFQEVDFLDRFEAAPRRDSRVLSIYSPMILKQINYLKY